MWSGFGYSGEYLARMESQSFWDAEFAAIDEIDRKLESARNL